MLKALLKKQFLELNTFYFIDRKTGKRLSKMRLAAMIAIFALLFVSLGAVFFGVAKMFVPLLSVPDLSWMYYSLLGMLGLVLGVFGSVFNTYAGLYRAKDNDLLLSMPIPPSKILFVRMAGVAAMSLMYEAIVMVPALIARFVYAPIGFSGAIFSVLLVFVLTALISVLTCILGFAVACLTAKFKNKSAMTVIFSLIFIAVYYFCYAKAYSMIQSLMLHSAAVGAKIRSFLYPFYQMGLAAEGDPLAMLIFTLIVAAAFAVTYWVLTVSFVGITTKSEKTDKKVYREKTVKERGMSQTLFRREWSRYLSNANYILNCSMGTLMMLIAAVAALVWRADLKKFALPIGNADFLPVLLTVGFCLILSMNDLTAPSVSLEGKTIWMLQSMPIPVAEIFGAKQKLQWVLTLPPMLLSVAAVAFAFRINLITAFYMAVFGCCYTMFLSAAGLALNLKFPNLQWTNEIVAIKQGASVALALFGSWFLTVAIGVAGYFLTKVMRADQVLLLFIVVFALASRMVNRWLNTRGVQIFGTL